MNKGVYDNEIAWAAGLIEGEGYIAYDQTPIVQVISTDKDVLERLQSIFGGTVCVKYRQKKNRKDAWTWSIFSNRAIECIQIVYPNLMFRRGVKADKVLQEWEEACKKRKQTKEKLKERHKHMLSLRSKGLTHRQIANEVGLCTSTISYHFRKTG